MVLGAHPSPHSKRHLDCFSRFWHSSWLWPRISYRTGVIRCKRFRFTYRLWRKWSFKVCRRHIHSHTQRYGLRSRVHDRTLPERNSNLVDCNFITRMLYLNAYWLNIGLRYKYAIFTVCRSYISYCVSKSVMSFCLLNDYWLSDWLIDWLIARLVVCLFAGPERKRLNESRCRLAGSSYGPGETCIRSGTHWRHLSNRIE